MKYLLGIFCITVICLFIPASLLAQDFLNGLVLAFSFEEGSGAAVKDISRNGNDGKINGNANWVEGKLGKALQFDGETYVSAPHIPFNDVDFTVQFWVKPEMVTEQEVAFSQHELNAANLSIHFRIHNNGMVRLGYYSNDLDTPPGLVKQGKWHNLTFQVDSSDNKRTIYIDGEEAATDISASAYLGAIGDIWIGGWERPTKAENPFYQVYFGAIDEVRVWSRLLSEDEILASMETEMAVEPKGKIATVWGAVKHSK